MPDCNHLLKPGQISTKFLEKRRKQEKSHIDKPKKGK